MDLQRERERTQKHPVSKVAGLGAPGRDASPAPQRPSTAPRCRAWSQGRLLLPSPALCSPCRPGGGSEQRQSSGRTRGCVHTLWPGHPQGPGEAGGHWAGWTGAQNTAAHPQLPALGGATSRSEPLPSAEPGQGPQPDPQLRVRGLCCGRGHQCPLLWGPRATGHGAQGHALRGVLGLVAPWLISVPTDGGTRHW